MIVTNIEWKSIGFCGCPNLNVFLVYKIVINNENFHVFSDSVGVAEESGDCPGEADSRAVGQDEPV